MTPDVQDALQETQREQQEQPSRLESIAFSAVGAVSGVVLGGALMYDPMSAAVGVAGVAAGAAVGAVCVVTAIYLSEKSKNIRRKLGALTGASALIACLTTGAGYSLGNYTASVRSVTPFTVEEERGIAIEMPRRNKHLYFERGTNYVSFHEAREDALRSVNSSYAEKKQSIQESYDKILHSLSPTNAATTNVTGERK